MEEILFIVDDDLIGKDLSELPKEFKKVTDFIFNQTSTLMNEGSKIYDRTVIMKLQLNKIGIFTVKIIMTKYTLQPLKIDVKMHAPSTVLCLIWNKNYTSTEEYNNDVKFILENITNIGLMFNIG